jgi:hypothetical protein
LRPRRGEQVAGDTLTHGGDGLVGEHDQVEVIHRDPRLRQRGPDGCGVASVRVDHHYVDRVAELGAALGQPRRDRGAGAATDLPHQCLLTGDVDEPGLPRVATPPPDPALVVHPAGQPPWAAEPSFVHPQHRRGLGLGELPRGVGHQRSLRRGHDTPWAVATSD